MRTEEIAARFDNRQGFAVVDFLEVGLPIYRLTCIALVQIQKRYPPIEEFVLRCLAVGLEEPSEISGMLGLSERVVEATLTNLIRNDDVFERQDGSVELTKRGEEAAREHVTIRPMDQSIVFFVDGLTRKSQWRDQRELYFPKQADTAGLKQIRAFPARRPNVDELDIMDVSEALRVGARTHEERRQLLKIKEVVRADRMFMPALLLIYKASRGRNIQVAFVIEGRISDDHEMAFLNAKGLEKLRIRELVGRKEPLQLSSLIGKKMAAEVEEEEKHGLEEASKVKRRAAVARFKASLAEDMDSNEARLEGQSSIQPEQPGANLGIQDVYGELRKLTVRPLAVYEHPRLLRYAISRVRKRLVIISPWITPAVVDREFLEQLETALERGVGVYIGYGLGEVSNREKNDNAAIDGLERVERKHEGMVLKRFGDTHAKILIKDYDFFVTTSFNWLSFRGDPSKPFREEYGTYVGIPEKVEAFFKAVIGRFD